MAFNLSQESVSSGEFQNSNDITMSLDWDDGILENKLQLPPSQPREKQNLIDLTLDLDMSLYELLFAPPLIIQESKQYAARRVQKIIDQVEGRRPLFHPSNTQEASSPQPPINLTFDLNTSNRTGGHFLYGSLEVLNSPSLLTAPNRVLNETYVESPVQSSFRMQKSFSSGCLPREEGELGREDAEESESSENELDEMGLPVWKHRSSHTLLRSKSNPDLQDTIAQFHALKSSIMAQPHHQPEEVQDEEENALNTTFPKPSTDEGRGSSRIQTSSCKGPMRALAPLHIMTKQIGLKTLSLMTSKKNKSEATHKPFEAHLGESFDEAVPPTATSTPTGGRLCNRSRRDSTGKLALTRSLSEGRMTPVKRAANILNVSYTKPNAPNPNAAPSKPNLVSNPLDQTSTVKPKVRNSMLRRPSLAPIKPLLTTNAPLKDKTNENRVMTGSKPARTSLVTSTMQPPLQTITSMKKPYLVSKSRRMSSLSKEN